MKELAQKEISKSVMYRLPRYLMYLKAMPEDSPANISATMLANALNMGEVQVRKDLALVSDGGRPKVGYNRKALIDDIEQFFGYVIQYGGDRRQRPSWARRCWTMSALQNTA